MDNNKVINDPADIREQEREQEIAYDLDIAPLIDMQEKAEKNGHWRC